MLHKRAAMTRLMAVGFSVLTACVAGCGGNPANPGSHDGSLDGGAGDSDDGFIGGAQDSGPGGGEDSGGGGTPTQRVATIKTLVAHTYVGAENGGGGGVYADRYAPQGWETFELVDRNGGDLVDGDLVNLKTSGGQFLSATSGGVNAAPSSAGANEGFRIGLVAKGDGNSGSTIVDGDSVSLELAGGTWLSAVNGGGAGLSANASKAGSNETFQIGPATGLATTRPLTGWKLTWSDEFNGAAGAIDGKKWTAEVNGSPANAELEFYTDRQSNVALDGHGNLILTARAEAYQGHQYTSGRINTSGHFTQAYGRFEARVWMPTGKGIWPAFWTLGDNIGSARWPACGELDIMETVGDDTDHNYGSAHGPGYSGGNPLTKGYTYAGTTLTDGYHNYAIEWEPNQVRWYVDGNLFETQTSADVPAGTTWVYDHPFFIILNVAVGGTWPGSPDGSTVFPQVMKVDYVRVYAKS
jgi:beta-glucanase (GH16 family)